MHNPDPQDWWHDQPATRRRPGDRRLLAGVFAVSWFALIGLIATCAWLIDQLAPLLTALGQSIG